MNIKEQIKEGVKETLIALGWKPGQNPNPKAEEIDGKLEQANEKITDLTDQLATKDTELAAEKEKVTQLKTDATEAEEAHAEALKAKDEEVDGKATTKANAKLKSLGIDPISDSGPGDTPGGNSKAALWEQYNALSDAKAKRAFWIKHREILDTDD